MRLAWHSRSVRSTAALRPRTPAIDLKCWNWSPQQSAPWRVVGLPRDLHDRSHVSMSGLQGSKRICRDRSLERAHPRAPSPPLWSRSSALAEKSAASHGIHDHPSIDMLPSVLSNARCRALALWNHRRAGSVHVVSHHLDGFLRAKVVGLLHPTADHRVRRIAFVGAIGTSSRWTTREIRAAQIVPFEESPSPAAVPRHRGRCLPTVRSSVQVANHLGVPH